VVAGDRHDDRAGDVRQACLLGSTSVAASGARSKSGQREQRSCDPAHA
jgi:hypothetical protein